MAPSQPHLFSDHNTKTETKSYFKIYFYTTSTRKNEQIKQNFK
jgi:hypothetical protein